MPVIEDLVFDLRFPPWDGLLSRRSTTLIDPVRTVPRPPPAFVLDLSGEDLRHDLFAVGMIPVGGILRCEWDDATVFGWDAFHAFLSPIGEFTTQDVNGNAFRIDHYLRNLPKPPYFAPAITRRDRQVRVDFTGIPDTHVVTCPGSTYFASPIEPLNWGMWLLHAIPSAIEYLQRGQDEVFGCWHRYEWQRNLLKSIGIGADRLFQVDEWKLHRFEHLTFRAYPSMELHVGEQDRLAFASIARRCSQSSAIARHDRIFVSRLSRSRSGAVRGLQNEAELASALSALGFLVVEPETLPFEDQVALFASAKVIVGLGGAGMFNAIFAAPGTKVVTIEASTAFIHNHANLFSSSGLDYAVIFGERNREDGNWPHHRWTLDVQKAVAAIKQYA